MNRAERFFTIGCVVLFFGFIYLFLGAIDKIDQRKEVYEYQENVQIISIQRLNKAIVRVETKSGDLYDFEADLNDPIDIGDTIKVTFTETTVYKEYEDANPNNDKVIKQDLAITDYEIVAE